MLFGISLVEWFGYAASVMVAVSLMMSSIVKLRWYNLIGAGMFSTYGFIIGALPVGFLNLWIVLIDIYYIIKMYTEKEYFKIIEENSQSGYVKYFIENNREEIMQIFPEFKLEKSSQKVYLLLRNNTTAGIVIGEETEDKYLKISVDFVEAHYRDFKIGKFIYSETDYFNSKYEGFRMDKVTDMHKPYIEKMGFKYTDKGHEKRIK